MWIDRLERRPYLVLAIAIAVQVATFVIGQRDLAAADPLWYASIAHRLATHASEVFASHDTHPFIMRVGLTAPIALGYLAFGVSTLVTNLPCLLAAVAILAVVYAAAPTPRAKLAGMALACACAPLVVRDANMLNPDLPCAAVMAVSILLLSRRDRGARWMTAAMAIWFAAFLVKESALWCAPIWIWAAIRDLRTDGRAATLRRFAPGLALGTALAIAYVGVCALVWGDPLARFHGVQALAHDHTWSLEGKPTHAWVARLVWEPAILAYKTFHFLLGPIIAAFVLVRGPARIWLVAAASTVLLFWFGSASLSVYSPLPVMYRMFFPAVPPLLVAAMLGTEAALERMTDVRWRRATWAAIALFAVLPHALGLRSLPSRRPEAATYAVLRADVARTDGPVIVVCADPRCVPLTDFYFGFEPPPRLTVVDAAAFAHAPRPSGATVRVVVEEQRAAEVGSNLATRADALALPVELRTPGARLYDAGDGTRLWQALQ